MEASVIECAFYDEKNHPNNWNCLLHLFPTIHPPTSSWRWNDLQPSKCRIKGQRWHNDLHTYPNLLPYPHTRSKKKIFEIRFEVFFLHWLCRLDSLQLLMRLYCSIQMKKSRFSALNMEKMKKKKQRNRLEWFRDWLALSYPCQWVTKKMKQIFIPLI